MGENSQLNVNLKDFIVSNCVKFRERLPEFDLATCAPHVHLQSVRTYQNKHDADMLRSSKNTASFHLRPQRIRRHNVHRGTFEFMRRLMDECTHLANYSPPIDTSLIVVPVGAHDLYYPRDHVMDLRRIWPHCEVRMLDTSHVKGYISHLDDFK